MKAYGIHAVEAFSYNPLILYNTQQKEGCLYTNLSRYLLWNPHYIHVWSSDLERDIRGASLDWEKIWTPFIYASKHLNYQ